MYKFLLLIAFLGVSLCTFAQSPPNYSKVQITLSNQLSIQDLVMAGIDIDHVHANGQQQVDFILEENEVEELKALGVPFEILIPDMSAYYAQILKTDDQALLNMNCGLEHFDAGEMGGYHSYDDMIAHIELMQQEFPELVKITPIGNSLENRTMYAVKISDQVDQDESAEEGVVYYDALTHAREPMGLETHLYYMWWLLENYGKDAEATFLIDHREMYFVPVVNPDGYVYNQSTNPDGGGLWRKNRRDNGNNCYGVDLNRNYGYEWGNLAGASNNVCAGTYHGTAAFSEPETQNVRDFVAQINPAIAFSCHAYSDAFLCPNAFDNDLPDYDVYADFSSEFVPEDYIGYGTWAMMIGYFGSGTTQDYLHYEGIIAWTPEIGHEFWEPSFEICDRIQEMFPTMKYISWVSGDYVAFQDYTLTEESQLWDGSDLELVIRVKNKGLTSTAQEVKISASSPLAILEAVQAEATIGPIAPRTFAQNDQQPIRFKLQGVVALGDEIPIDINISQDGMLSSTRRITLHAGIRDVLFTEDGELVSLQWETTGDPWQRTEMDAFRGDYCLTDSPDDNYTAGAQNTFQLKEAIDFTMAENPYIEFKAKWSLEPEEDFVRFEASYDGGTNWEALAGKYTQYLSGLPTYTGHQHWVDERISLEDFVGVDQLLLRFVLEANIGGESDGFYFDDFQVIEYRKGNNVGTENIEDIAKAIQAFPNPNTGETTLQLDAERSELAKVSISDINGKLLLEQGWDLERGTNVFPLTLIKSGTYLVKVVWGTKTEVIKMVNRGK